MTTYVNSLRKLTLTTAVAALMAAPVAAQSLDAGVGSDVSADVAGTEVDANVAADVDGSLPADQAATDIDTALDGSSIAVASDDTVIGAISNVEPQPDGSVRYSIDLSSDLDVDSDRAVVQIDQVVDAEGQLVIGMTGEEFAAALTHQMNAGGAEQTQTN